MAQVVAGGRRMTYEEEMILEGVGRQPGLYDRNEYGHDMPEWRVAAFGRVAVYTMAKVRETTMDPTYVITGQECEVIYKRLRKQYHAIQKKLFLGLWDYDHMTIRNQQICDVGWYLARHVHHKNPEFHNWP